MKNRSDWIKALLLILLPLLVYGSGLGRGFVFDDIDYIAENPLLRRSDAFRLFWFSSEAFNYYPLFWSLLRVQWLLWGDHALGYHVVTLIGHCANALLVWRITQVWRVPAGWWAAALFAVHPVNVQTVVWAAEQKNTWSFLFMALALLAFLQHARSGGWRSYLISFACYLAALGCKTSTLCLPVFLIVYFAFRPDQRSRALLVRLVPFLLAGIAAGLTTMWFEQHRVGAQSLMGTLSLWSRLEAAGAAFWFYCWKAILPIHLTTMYAGWVDTTAAAHTAIPGILLVLLLTACALFWRRLGAPVALGLAYYAIMLLPLLGVFDTNYFIYSQIADHWQYHALPGLLIAVVAATRFLASRAPQVLPYTTSVGAVSVAMAAILASAHAANFADARTLWSYTTAENPSAWMAWYNLGNVHAEEREYRAAITAYGEAVRLRPEHYVAHINLANALAADGQLVRADEAYLRARQTRANDPDCYVNRGVVLLRLGREEEAVSEFSHALKLDPAKRSAAVNLVVLNLRRGRIAEATEHLQPGMLVGTANSRRVADALATRVPDDVSARESLERFVARACELSGGQRELLAAAVAR